MTDTATAEATEATELPTREGASWALFFDLCAEVTAKPTVAAMKQVATIYCHAWAMASARGVVPREWAEDLDLGTLTRKQQEDFHHDAFAEQCRRIGELLDDGTPAKVLNKEYREAAKLFAPYWEIFTARRPRKFPRVAAS